MRGEDPFERLSVIAVAVLIAAAVLVPVGIWLWELLT